MKSAHVNFKEFLYFSLFSSVTSAAFNTIQISYGISYFRHRDSSDIFTYDIARQSVVDKMVREISLEVREKSGNFFPHFCGNPGCGQMGHTQARCPKPDTTLPFKPPGWNMQSDGQQQRNYNSPPGNAI